MQHVKSRVSAEIIPPVWVTQGSNNYLKQFIFNSWRVVWYLNDRFDGRLLLKKLWNTYENLTPLACGDRVISVWLGQYHCCRCPGSSRRQVISSHDNFMGSPCLTRWRIPTTYVVSVWRNDRNCKYMFMFLLKNLARKQFQVKSLQWHHTNVTSNHRKPHWGLNKVADNLPRRHIFEPEVLNLK